jgi:transcriptional regulator GlxA family with amidase domain
MRSQDTGELILEAAGILKARPATTHWYNMKSCGSWVRNSAPTNAWYAREKS